MKIYKSIILLVIACIISVICWAEDENQVNQWLNQLNSSKWEERSIAVTYLDQLKENQKTEKVKIALINLLKKEVTIEKDGEEYITTCIPSKSEGEGHGEYICILLDAVARLRDERSVPILVKFNTGESIEALVEIGEPSVKPLLKELINNKDSNAIYTLGEIVKFKTKGYVAQGEIREKIKQALIKALKDAIHPRNKAIEEYEAEALINSDIRRETIRALGNFEDPKIIPVIKPYLNDTYSEEREKTELRQEGKKAMVVKVGEVTVYPVREEAERVIKLLEEKKKEEK